MVLHSKLYYTISVQKLVFLGMAALMLPEQPTVAAASSFFLSFIVLSPTMTSVGQVLQLNGKLLVQDVLQAVAGAAPRSYVASFSDILNCLHGHCVTWLSQWLDVITVQSQLYRLQLSGPSIIWILNSKLLIFVVILMCILPIIVWITKVALCVYVW